MDYFSKFIRGAPSAPKATVDHAAEFHKAWSVVKNTLQEPDERQLSRGISSTDVPAQLQLMVDALVKESVQSDVDTGACLDYMLTNDVLNTLVRLGESDRPYGIQAEILRIISSLVQLLDEHFLVHASVHKAVIRLLRACAGDELPEAQRGTGSKPMGAALASSRVSISDYEEDLVNLLCIICSRIRTFPDLLMIFFHDKNWYSSSGTIFEEDEGEEEDEEDEEEEEEEEENTKNADEGESEVNVEDAGSFAEPLPEAIPQERPLLQDLVIESDPWNDPGDDTDLSATPTKHSVLLALASEDLRSSSPPPLPPVEDVTVQKPQYEFLIFNYLMRFIHREGTVGDFGRAGLLFLMDVAMSPADIASQLYSKADDPVTDAALALADYILEGDFSDVLAAGLGAVYSLLPYKLEVKRHLEGTTDGNSDTGGGMILGVAPVGTVDEEKQKIESEEERITGLGVEVSNNLDFKARLDHFLNLIEFAEDVLRRTAFENTGRVDGGETVVTSSTTTVNLGRAIAQSVVDKIRAIFLQNVLYPSILECSDADGSAVAVLSYIDSLLRTMIAGGKLSEAFIDFLMADDDGQHLTKSSVGVGRRPQPMSRADKKTKTNRRRSSAMVLLELEAPHSMGHSDYFSSLGRFTLKDLIISNLKSQPNRSTNSLNHSDAAGVAALKLLYLLLTSHCNKTVDGLLTVVRDPTATNFPRPLMISTPHWPSEDSIREQEEDDDDEFIYPGTAGITKPRRVEPLFLQPSTTASTYQEELRLYMELVSRIDTAHKEDSFSTGYENYLKDAVESIQGQSCYDEGLSEWIMGGLAPAGSGALTKQHRLLPTDPLLSSLLLALRNFFSYTPEYNVALTGVIASICACPNRSVAGWLMLASDEDEGHKSDAWTDHQVASSTFAPIQEKLDDSDGDDASVDFPRQGNATLPSESRLKDAKFQPVLYTVLSGLVAQLDRYRMIVDDFDSLLNDRRNGLLFMENLNDALTLTLHTNDFIQTGNQASLSVPKPSANSSPKPKSKSNKSLIPSFLAPKKAKSSATSASEAGSSTHGPDKGANPASPFAPHYQRTNSIDVEPFVAPPPAVGPWSLSSKRGIAGSVPLGLGGISIGMSGSSGLESDDIFATSTGQVGDREEEVETVTISLSRLLDNVVILEEAIKELTAIAQTRCSLGIDGVRYL